MQEADMGVTSMALDQNNSRYNGDDKLLVKFFKHPLINESETREQGRPIYEDKDYIQIMQPGNKDSIVIRPATQMDKERFAEHYRRYQAREGENYVEGTRLEEWPGITRSMVEELKHFNIFTVEQIVEGVSDSNAQNIVGFSLLRDRAVAYLEASDTEAAAAAKIEAQQTRDQLAQALERINDLEQKLTAQGEAPAETEQPRRRRRAAQD